MLVLVSVIEGVLFRRRCRSLRLKPALKSIKILCEMPSSRGFRYWTLVALVSFWLVLLAWPALGGSFGLGSAGWVYLFFRPICHQIPSRSFHLLGHQLAVCHRCTGIYVGFWLGLVLLPSWRWLSGRLQEHPRLLILFALPMAVNVLLENTPWGRFGTGLVAGFPFSLFVWMAVEQLYFQSAPRRKTV